MLNLSVTGQIRQILTEDNFNSAGFKTYEIEIKKKWFDSIHLNFTYPVEFIDSRADKSKLGFIRMGETNSFYNFDFPGQDIAYINSKLTDLTTSSIDTGRILVVINHLWISQIIVKSTKADGFFKDDKAYISFCNFDADYYLQKGKSIRYLGKLDTVISIRKWIGKVADELLKETLKVSLSKCNELIIDPPLNSYFSGELLIDSLKNKFSYPILTSGSPKKGIYRNYEDFLYNRPIEVDFEVKADKKGTILRSNLHDTSVTHKAWGYSDGENIYKHLNESYFKMNRVENTFELAGPRSISKLYAPKEVFLRTVVDAFLLQFGAVGITMKIMHSNEKIMRELVPYQLNIQEGTFY